MGQRQLWWTPRGPRPLYLQARRSVGRANSAINDWHRELDRRRRADKVMPTRRDNGTVALERSLGGSRDGRDHRFGRRRPAAAQGRRAVLARAREDYALNNQAAVSLLGLTSRYRIGMVTELEPDVLQSAGITPVDNPEAFIAGSLDDHGAGSVTVIRAGASTLPYISGREEN